MNTETVVYQPAADTVRAFENLLTEQGLGYYIVSTWAGWRRHGVIRVVPLDARREPDWTKPPVQREEFARSSSAGGSQIESSDVCAQVARNTSRYSTSFRG